MMPPARDVPAASADDPARTRLKRFRRVASGLLVLMAALALLGAVGTRHWPHEPWAPLLAASASAGLVGGLADWFAVTALFRHPLGLPIPHTAIIPAQKARLGRALGQFVAHQVFTEDDLARALARIDLPALLHEILADPALGAAAGQGLRRILPRLLDGMENGRARRLLHQALVRVLSGEAAGRVVARALRALVEGERHQEVLSFVLTQIKALIQSKEVQLRTFIEDRVREQGGRLVGWAIGSSIAAKVLVALNQEFERMDPYDSELRAAFTGWVVQEIDRIEQEPARAGEIGASLGGLLAHRSVRFWLSELWQRLRQAAEADAARKGSWLGSLTEDALARLAAVLRDDPAAQAGVQRAAVGFARRALPRLQVQLSDYIAGVVGGWDGQAVADRLELRVGKDLQYIRINGTLVGFVAGGLVHLVLAALVGAGF